LTREAPQTRDPQAEALASYLPMSAERIGKMLPLLPSLLIEFIPMAAMLLATVLWDGAGTGEARPVAMQPPGAVRIPESEAPAEASVPSIATEQAERAVLDRVALLVLKDGGELITPAIRNLANYLHLDPSAFSSLIDKWQREGLIQVEKQRTRTVLTLPDYSAKFATGSTG
jgi:hypothetical protein